MSSNHCILWTPGHNYTVMAVGLGDYRVAIYSKYVQANISYSMYVALCYLYSKRCYDAVAYCIELACDEARRAGTAQIYKQGGS